MLMRYLKSTLVLVFAVALAASSGCKQGSQPEAAKASLDGFASVDLVGGSESIAPDGQMDASISVRVDSGGTLTAIQVSNVDGQAAVWDTIPGNSVWVIGVADKEDPQKLLNGADGSIEIKVDKPREYLLYFSDNGAVRDGKTDFAVTLTFKDGNKKEIPVAKK
jgi:hypothetical protein